MSRMRQTQMCDQRATWTWLALTLAVVVPRPLLPPTDIRHPGDGQHNMVILVRALIHGPPSQSCAYIDTAALTPSLCI
jgi:hypothetical protein